MSGFKFPNITGNLYTGWDDTTAPGLILAWGSTYHFGALFPTKSSNLPRSTYAQSHVTDTTGKYFNTIGFQAKKSESRYGATTIIQPASFQFLMIVKH